MLKLIFLLFFVFSTFILTSNDIKIESERIIRINLGDYINLQFEIVGITPELKNEIEKKTNQRFFKDFVYKWNIIKHSKQIATAYVDNVYGKTQPITFLVIINNEGEIVTTEILKYREQYGGQVKNKNWLDQFNGKDLNSEIEVGKNIHSISGATISVNSVTTGIKKILFLHAELIKVE